MTSALFCLFAKGPAVHTSFAGQAEWTLGCGERKCFGSYWSEPREEARRALHKGCKLYGRRKTGMGGILPGACIRKPEFPKMRKMAACAESRFCFAFGLLRSAVSRPCLMLLSLAQLVDAPGQIPDGRHAQQIVKM